MGTGSGYCYPNIENEKNDLKDGNVLEHHESMIFCIYGMLLEKRDRRERDGEKPLTIKK